MRRIFNFHQKVFRRRKPTESTDGKFQFGVMFESVHCSKVKLRPLKVSR